MQPRSCVRTGGESGGRASAGWREVACGGRDENSALGRPLARVLLGWGSAGRTGRAEGLWECQDCFQSRSDEELKIYSALHQGHFKGVTGLLGLKGQRKHLEAQW